MKKILSIALLATAFTGMIANAQKEKPPVDKSKRPSPPAIVTQEIKGGAMVKIDYSQPSVKGRTIGTDLEPKPGQVWRTGANEATVFEIDKDVMVEGQALPAGKYGLFTLVEGDQWTFIFNKTWNQWGAFKYSDKEDALRVTVRAGKSSKFYEQMTFAVNKKGVVSLMWGDIEVSFNVK
ncbi:MAG: DUF2911 domain-containing protein [Chitinophagaceae bacterium]